MTTQVKPSKAAASVAECSDRRRSVGLSMKGRLAQVFVCLPLEGGVHGVHLRILKGGTEAREFRIGSAGDWKKAARDVGGRCPVVALLPKSLYLMRTLELPKVADEDVPAMLRLEVGAHLPPEFGEMEVSYRPIAPRKEGCQSHESHVARREDLNGYLARLIQVGIYPDLVLPSCVAWGLLLERVGNADLLVASLGAEQLEAASRSEDGSINIRTLNVGGSMGEAEVIQRSLIEYVRSMLTQNPVKGEAVSIGWLGTGCPWHLANGRILFRGIEELLPGMTGEETPADPVGLTLRCFAEAMLAAGRDSILQVSNLLPSDVLIGRERRVVRRLTLMGAFLILLAFGLTDGALRIASQRYQVRIAELSSRVALIRREGEAVGRRIEQLQAIGAARATRNDFARIIAGLCDSAPQGLSYNSVEMDEAGRIRLLGQAESLAMAFMLPEQLEKAGGFTDVQPGDAARSRKGEGTIAEFRVNCGLGGRFNRAEKSASSLRSEPGVGVLNQPSGQKGGR